MKKTFILLLLNVILFIVYYYVFAWLKDAYPLPQISWDSNYYIRSAFNTDYGLRPSGYPYFLGMLYDLSPTLDQVVNAQFILHYISIITFLFAIHKIFKIRWVMYAVGGLLMLLEPVALYHINSILSDQLFSSLTILALSTLLLYFAYRSPIFLIFHIALMFLCIEVRHIGLFYPFFTIITLLLFSKNIKHNIAFTVLILVAFFAIHRWHVNENIQRFNSAVYSPFSGWTHANNAIYSLRYADIEANDISDEGVRKTHILIKKFLDSTGYREEAIGSAYLWTGQSPLNIIREQVMDTLRQRMDDNEAWYTSWYTLAPTYADYGIYIQSHYPLAYYEGYIQPNVATLISPHIGEMGDYYAAPVNDTAILNRYSLKETDFKGATQVYKNTINEYIIQIYQYLLILFTICSVAFLCRYKSFERASRIALSIILIFTLTFYGSMLYSSWFMCRYLLPIYMLMITVVIITIPTYVHKLGKSISKT